MAAYAVIQVNHKPGVTYDRTQATHRKTTPRHPPTEGEMTFYERFEHFITLILSSVIRVIVVIALWRLISGAGRPGGHAFRIV
jgi:hypothetical protein